MFAIRRRALCSLIVLFPLVLGGCPRPEDSLEPNDSPSTATRLMLGVPTQGRVIQGNRDVFVVAAGPNVTLVFEMTSLGEEEEDCVAFSLIAPDGTTLYEDHRLYCRAGVELPTQVDGAGLTQEEGIGYELSAPAAAAGDYVLTLTELGEVDNLFDYSWQYRITARTE